MKILTLRLAGFGPYRHEQTIDFEQFDAEGIFLITGKTGAGKSSILDAICFALYDSIPRYDGRDSRPRSHHCDIDDPTYVELDFSLRGETYRIHRTCEYERPSKRGDKMVTAGADARLERLDEGKWVGLAAKPRDVGLLLADILPIKKDQFLQVILLAQNRFQQFLLAKTSERRDVLRTLFNTARFERLEAALIERRKSLDAEVESVNASLAGHAATIAEQCDIDEPAVLDTDWFAEARSGLAISLTGRTEMTDRLRDEVAVAETALRELEAIAGRQDRLETARAKQRILTERVDQIDRQRARLDEAERAERVWSQIEAWQVAVRRSAEAGAALEAADERWSSLCPDSGESGASRPEDASDESARSDLGAVMARLNTLLGSLDSAVREEADLARLGDAVARAAAEVLTDKARLDGLQSRSTAIPAQLAELDAALTELAVLAATADEREAGVTLLITALRAAERAATLESDVLKAQRAEVTESTANREAAARYEHLVQGRISNMAFELATELAAGEPCTVCGATEHPAPASTDAEPVTAEAVDSAREAMQAQQRKLQSASDLVRARSAELSEQRTRSGGKSVEALTGELSEARTRLAEARTAEARREELSEQRHVVRAEADDIAEAIDKARAESEAAATRRTEAAITFEAAQALVETHRAGYGSVRERVAHVRELLSAARDLDEAARQHAERSAATEHAKQALTVQLADQQFESTEDAATARIGGAHIEKLRAEIRLFDDEVSAARAVVDDPELKGLPDERVDPAPASRTLSDKRDLLDAALSALGALKGKLATVDRRIADATALFARSESLLDEHRQVRELAAVVRGDEPNTKRIRLETFVLAAQLEEIITAANQRLRAMTDSRYSLQLDDAKQYRNVETGLGLSVFDEHTGVARQTASLSGGEMFLASLSLALGLAEVVSGQAGGIRLDTLFVDEGFGSLDGETLEVAMHALDSLRAGGRTIGLISHVESMKEQIPAKLAISVNAAGESAIASDRVAA